VIKKSLVIAGTLLASSMALSCTQGFDQDGILPKNKLRIPTTFFKAGGNTIDEAVFNRVINDVSKIYTPIVAKLGATLYVERRWTDPTVNAFADRSGTKFQVHMFGGLARHPEATEDAFAMVICHELGHHLAGFPKVKSLWGSQWASNEGQSDYFASTKCLRKYFRAKGDSAAVVSRLVVPPTVQKKCFESFGQSAADQAMCVRSSLAGLALGKLLNSLAQAPKPPTPAFETPSKVVAAKTLDAHPPAQCRVDTYFAGSYCKESDSVDFDNKKEVVGACGQGTKFASGARPVCWFKPSAKSTFGSVLAANFVR
jgi:hypothetical protein